MGRGRFSCRLRARVSTVNPHGIGSTINAARALLSLIRVRSVSIFRFIVISIQKLLMREKVPEIWRFVFLPHWE